MPKEKAPQREQREILKGDKEAITFRLPSDLNNETKRKAEKIGIAQNAYLLMMIDLGMRVYEANFSINLHQSE